MRKWAQTSGRRPITTGMYLGAWSAFFVMAAKRKYAWTKDHGWVRAKTEEDAKYDNMGDGWPFLIAVCRFFPDFVADLFRAENADFELSLIQRVFLRINARYQYVDITACRGATKSFCTDLGEYNEMLWFPGQISAIVGPSFKQTAKIASQIYKQVCNNYPGLTNLLTVDADSVDRFALTTPYGSKMSIEAFRGNTIHKATAEETAQENAPAFDAEEYKEVVIPAVRGEYKIEGKRSPAYVQFKQHSITSAGRQQAYAFETRRNHKLMMSRGESAFVIDVPYDVILLEQMRPIQWAENIRNELTPEAWMREMESIYSGSDKNPIVRDEVLTSSRNLALMEEHHCCKDLENRLKPDDVIYIVAMDVAYRDNKNNAKCAVVVVKLTKQKDYFRRNQYLKQVVWVEDWPAGETPTPMAQAQKLRHIWFRYCFDGSETYIVLDSWQFGNGVLTSLMEAPENGGVPLCVIGHKQYTELEEPGAVPVIYPIKAGGVGTTDPDSDMIQNAEMQFEHGNVQLLTPNINEGVEQFKRYHRIKDDSINWKIAMPYKKTSEMVTQIQNLREVPSGAGISEKRISNRIQRDSWSALKYALRLAQILERQNLQIPKKQSDWTPLLKGKQKITTGGAGTGKSRLVAPIQRGRIV